MKHVITCRPSGIVEAVQNDELPLHDFGRATMTRASDVVWSDEDQKWVATIRPEFRIGKEDYEFKNKSRQVCIDWEINFLNAR